MKHIVVTLHESGWTPGTPEDVELPSGFSDSLFNKRNAKLLVMTDVKGFQLLVAFGYVRVATAGKIAAVNVRSRKGVTDARIAIKVGVENFLLSCLGQLCICLSSSIRKRATNTQHCLKGSIRIDKDAYLSLERLAHRLKSQ